VRYLLFLAFFFFSQLVLSQNKIEIENGIAYNAVEMKPFLNTLHEQNEYVIAFRVLLPSSSQAPKPDYFILTRLGNNIQAFRYKDELEKLRLSDQSLALLWKNLMQNELFAIKDEKELSNFCPKKYAVYHSYSYEFTLISKTRMKILSYYYPEHYDEVCFGMAERKKIINAVSAIDLLALKDGFVH
jgi:hypothetical protein